jgi:hypothetical protein
MTVLLFVTSKTPMLKTQEKMVGCWLFTSGPVSLSVKIERKGYCNGKQQIGSPQNRCMIKMILNSKLYNL